MCIAHFYGYMRAVARASPRLPGTTAVLLLASTIVVASSSVKVA